MFVLFRRIRMKMQNERWPWRVNQGHQRGAFIAVIRSILACYSTSFSSIFIGQHALREGVQYE